MKTVLILGAFCALATGVAIGVQATLTSRAGDIIGNLRTGLLTNFLGGVLAGVVILILFLQQGSSSWKIPTTALAMVAVSGTLGIMIITGISFSLQRAGVAAGLATIILGQLIVSVFVDARGIGNVEPIPLTIQRIGGLFVMAVAVYMLMPRN
ncbi:MAG: DMT family transporter [Anaerolineales bacterium]|nr:DMT family transporter [Anaerolineales bacterium]